jgi:hypothetical protein
MVLVLRIQIPEWDFLYVLEWPRFNEGDKCEKRHISHSAKPVLLDHHVGFGRPAHLCPP